jgi:hypothetical protein
LLSPGPLVQATVLVGIIAPQYGDILSSFFSDQLRWLFFIVASLPMVLSSHS